MADFIPVIVGVADIRNKSVSIDDAREPMELMLAAINQAIEDTTISNINPQEFARAIDSIDVVATWTWPYPDLPGLLAKNLGAKPKHTHYSNHGGNQPAKLLDDASRRIASGESQLAVITGGEALASLNAFVAAKRFPPAQWTAIDQDIKSVFSPTTRQLEGNLGATHSIGAPIHVYPLIENGFRAHRNQDLRENNRESAKLYAQFARVAEQHPFAWNSGNAAQSAEYIGTPSAKNRMICFPYPLLMNAFNTVNLSAACLLTSTEHARALGIPESQWIYPLGGAGTADSPEFWERPNFYYSPSMSRSLDAALQVSGLSVEQVDMFDFYSCFPIVPKLACHHLGMPMLDNPKSITLLGGLTSFGGAGNNYSMHALTAMVRKLRQGSGQNGLVLANGGVMTYQHVVCLSRQPRRDGSPYPSENPLPDYVDDFQIPMVEETVNGEAAIETYTVEFARNGLPMRGYIVGRLRSNGHRFIANHADEITLQQLASTTIEPIGRIGTVKHDSKTNRNLFSLRTGLKL